MHNVIDLNLCVFVHDDHSSLSWILEYHASKLSILDDEHQVTIHLINSGTQLDSSDLSFLDNYDINISVWNLFNLSLAEKILYWYNAVNLKSNSLVWFHPADQISIIDIQYFVNINFDFTSPTVYSGYEFFIHKSLVPNRQSSDVRICSSRAQLSVDSPNDLPFLNLQIVLF